MMIPDPTEEIKAIRHRLGAEFDYDLDRIFADIQRRQSESGRTYVTRPSRRIANNQAMQRSGGGDVSDNAESTPAAR
ncbi:MAG: hypothetical protein Q8M16_06800 [Pirellulaceae bacterium]|nr:hypothetical protein [Pirellulaceae bacterium]